MQTIFVIINHIIDQITQNQALGLRLAVWLGQRMSSAILPRILDKTIRYFSVNYTVYQPFASKLKFNTF